MSYVHGFSESEQQRLYTQAQSLAPYIYDTINFSNVSTLVELGSGVGAQTEVILQQFPNLNVACVDANSQQLQQAQQHLSSHIGLRRVSLHECMADSTPFQNDHFDAAWLCWFLEHISNPAPILIEAKRILKPNGAIYCNEVLNQSFLTSPHTPASFAYLDAFNQLQIEFSGNPNAGNQLGTWLHQAGFSQIKTYIKHFQGDARDEQQKVHLVNYWESLMLSAANQLLENKCITQTLVDDMQAEFNDLRTRTDATILFAWMQAHATK